MFYGESTVALILSSLSISPSPTILPSCATIHYWHLLPCPALSCPSFALPFPSLPSTALLCALHCTAHCIAPYTALFCDTVQRAEKLNLTSFPFLGRVLNQRLRMKDTRFQSR